MAIVPDVASMTTSGSVRPSHRPLHVNTHSIQTSATTQHFEQIGSVFCFLGTTLQLPSIQLVYRTELQYSLQYSLHEAAATRVVPSNNASIRNGQATVAKCTYHTHTHALPNRDQQNVLHCKARMLPAQTSVSFMVLRRVSASPHPAMAAHTLTCHSLCAPLFARSLLLLV